ncbi:hypothetical protein HWV62_33937 [Athelia sp. TMB]|nr:hypothetical protein HWV62_33937 [Athelia sp. TMB]
MRISMGEGGSLWVTATFGRFRLIRFPPFSMSQSLKRSNSDAGQRSSTVDLPQLRGEIILQVFTHKSLQQLAESVKNERMAELGHQILRTAITHTLFHHKEPVLDVEMMIVCSICLEIGFYSHYRARNHQAHREDLLGDKSIEHWVNLYGLRHKVRCLPESFDSLDTPEVYCFISLMGTPVCSANEGTSASLLQERRFLFYTYVGAVCVQDGIQVVQTWIDQLIRPNGSASEREKTLEADAEGCHGESSTGPPAKRIKIEPGYINTSQGQILAPVLPPRYSSSVPRFSSVASTPPTRSVTPSPLAPEPHERPPPPASSKQAPNMLQSLPTMQASTLGVAHTPPSQTVDRPPLPPTGRSIVQRELPPHITVVHPLSPNPLAPAQPKAAFLPLFNQMAAQRRVAVSYTFESSGPAHALRWRAVCLGQ